MLLNCRVVSRSAGLCVQIMTHTETVRSFEKAILRLGHFAGRSAIGIVGWVVMSLLCVRSFFCSSSQ